jgi:hypothetical protein
MRANTVQIVNSGELNPHCRPTLNARAVTNDEWELGMPPEPTSLVKSSFLSLTNTNTTFKSCAIAQAVSDIPRVL